MTLTFMSYEDQQAIFDGTLTLEEAKRRATARHQEHLERIGPLNEPFPLACEHHFAPTSKNRTGPCKCVHCGLVSHNVIPSLRG